MSSSIMFCDRCRGMKVGWNRRYVIHSVTCTEAMLKSAKLLVLTLFVSIPSVVVLTPNAFVSSDQDFAQPLEQATLRTPPIVCADAAIRTTEAFLEKYKVDLRQRARIADALVASGRKYNVDPRLLASIMLVESRANPFAISGSDAVGIMQVHLPTWGQRAIDEGINLLKIEDNIEFGTRILSDYIHHFGLWEGVKRYNGWNPESTASAEAVSGYVSKVRQIYGHSTTETSD